MTRTFARASALILALSGALLLQGCIVGTAVGVAGAVVGTGVKATGAVVGAGVDAVTTSDEETKARREREQRDWERQQRRCEERQRRGRDC
jgi:carbonic anhydrase/acetyltransferase-like protein (isoleucine patch superfamily)